MKSGYFNLICVFWNHSFVSEQGLGVRSGFLTLRRTLTAQCNPLGPSARPTLWRMAEGGVPLRRTASFLRRSAAVVCVPLLSSARSTGNSFQRLFCELLSDCFPFCSEHCWSVLLGILPCLWSIYSCLSLSIWCLSLEYWFMLWFPFLVSLVYWSFDS